MRASRLNQQIRSVSLGFKDPENQALYFYKLIPTRKIELSPAFPKSNSSQSALLCEQLFLQFLMLVVVRI
jgi:hypothetical protein